MSPVTTGGRRSGIIVMKSWSWSWKVSASTWFVSFSCCTHSHCLGSHVPGADLSNRPDEPWHHNSSGANEQTNAHDAECWHDFDSTPVMSSVFVWRLSAFITCTYCSTHAGHHDCKECQMMTSWWMSMSLQSAVSCRILTRHRPCQFRNQVDAQAIQQLKRGNAIKKG